MTGFRPADGNWPGAGTTVVGVIGDPIAHSWSPLLHNTAFGAMGLDWVSLAFQVRRGAAGDALAGLRSLGLAGLSVTMPHKGDVARMVDERTAVARTLDAVNCVYWRGPVLVGDNTDGEGFLAAVRRGAGFDPRGRRCMVVGAGGAARAVILALAEAGALEVVVVNRTSERAAAAAALAGSTGRVGAGAEASGMDLVVEATPVGMAGVAGADRAIVDARLFGSGQVVVDLVYHPLVTPWLETAGQAGATVLGGLGMLVHQAAAQIQRWVGAEPPVEALWKAVGQVVGTPTIPGVGRG
ncbi:MAG: shikimate dehydrogenase [Acidimicrobiales bacterium]